MSAANKVESIVIGAGVIGLAVARNLAKRHGKDVLLLERAAMIGSETSSRNSSVIHSGIYYPKHSYKAQFCVRGKQLLYDYCEKRNIPFRRCGKLIVAASDHQFQTTIQNLHKQAQENGVIDTEILTSEQVKEREPLVQSCGALYSPSTGIIDTHEFMTSLLADAENSGRATLALNTTVENIRMETNGVISVYAGGTWVCAEYVVNAAGLWADGIARLIHKNHSNNNNNNNNDTTTAWQPPQQYYCKGNYYRLHGTMKQPPFHHLIYPVPDERGGLGVHATVDLAGGIKFGPDVEWIPIEMTHPDTINYAPNTSHQQDFYNSIRTYFPSLPDNSLLVDYSGVRPKLSHPNLDASTNALLLNDFSIATHEHHKIPRLVHLFGMESPGLTSAMAIADYVCDKLLQS
jgi:L-2-hydroxyglutarate oxidase LhgO